MPFTPSTPPVTDYVRYICERGEFPKRTQPRARGEDKKQAIDLVLPVVLGGTNPRMLVWSAYIFTTYIYVVIL